MNMWQQMNISHVFIYGIQKKHPHCLHDIEIYIFYRDTHIFQETQKGKKFSAFTLFLFLCEYVCVWEREVGVYVCVWEATCVCVWVCLLSKSGRWKNQQRVGQTVVYKSWGTDPEPASEHQPESIFYWLIYPLKSCIINVICDKVGESSVSLMCWRSGHAHGSGKDTYIPHDPSWWGHVAPQIDTPHHWGSAWGWQAHRTERK